MALVARRAVRLSVRRHFRSDGRRAVKAFNDFQWQNATVAKSENACSNGQLVSVSLNVNQHVLDPFTKPGQFVQLRLSEEQEKPAFIAVATAPPTDGSNGGTIGLLVKSVPDTTAEELCKLPPGGNVLVSPAMGPGFPIESIADAKQIYLVCTGSGLAPIKSLIESNALKGETRQTMTLLYGIHSKEHNPLNDQQIAHWQSDFNINPVFVYSEDGDGYVQDELKRRKENIDGANTGACFCGQKEMVQDAKAVLSEAGVHDEKMLLNF